MVRSSRQRGQSLYRSDAVAFWTRVRLYAGLGVLITVVMGLVNPLVVLAVDDTHPSGALYLLLTVLSGGAAAGVMLRAACRHPQARTYARRHLSVSVLPAGVGITSVVAGCQVGLLARLFGDTSPQTFWALGVAVAGITVLGLVVRAAANASPV